MKQCLRFIFTQRPRVLSCEFQEMVLKCAMAGRRTWPVCVWCSVLETGLCRLVLIIVSGGCAGLTAPGFLPVLCQTVQVCLCSVHCIESIILAGTIFRKLLQQMTYFPLVLSLSTSSLSLANGSRLAKPST